MTSGLPAGLPAWREFFDQLAEMRSAHGHAQHQGLKVQSEHPDLDVGQLNDQA
ncbi:hypothetical protein ACFWIY_18865 [Streptomyces sioyaensis]|uniref:hypothetical protein n=1 Tax=Streptomyces sioyaensis TaxID=67364 RepID=UPI00365E833B